MKYGDLIHKMLTRDVEEHLISIHEFETAIPAEIVLTFHKRGRNSLYLEIVRLAAMQVFPNRIKKRGILIDDKTNTKNEVKIHIRYAAKGNQKRYLARAGEKPQDITRREKL